MCSRQKSALIVISVHDALEFRGAEGACASFVRTADEVRFESARDSVSSSAAAVPVRTTVQWRGKEA